MLLRIIRLSEVESVYQKSLTLLNQDIKTLNGRTGWHQFIGEQRVGDVATAQGVLVLSYLNRSHPLSDDLLSTLEKAQYQGRKVAERGGWSFLSSRDTPTVEPTAWSVLSLLMAGSPPDPVVAAGRDWIKKNQNADGGWGPRKGLVSRIYCTFLACRCLLLLEPQFIRDVAPIFQDAVRWLIGCQNADGGWGACVGENSNAIHTAFALLSLHALGLDHITREMQDGIQFINAQWKPETMWEHTQRFEQYEIPKGPTDWSRITFHYFPTAWIITTLLDIGEGIFQEHLFLSVKWLIRSQNIDGTWTLMGVQRNRLWAVHDAILALSTFIDKAISTKTVDRMVLLDDVLILTKGHNGNGLLRLALLAVTFFLLVGAAVGVVFGSALGLQAYVGTWARGYWAWLALAFYMVIAVGLARLKVITWKEALLGLLIPALLIIIQIYLKP